MSGEEDKSWTEKERLETIQKIVESILLDYQQLAPHQVLFALKDVLNKQITLLYLCAAPPEFLNLNQLQLEKDSLPCRKQSSLAWEWSKEDEGGDAKSD